VDSSVFSAAFHRTRIELIAVLDESVYLTCFYGKPLLDAYDMTLTIDNESDTSFEDIINDILSQDNVMLSIKSTAL
jgi:hypothetical protein